MKKRFFRFICKHPKNKLIFIKNYNANEQHKLRARSLWFCPECYSLIKEKEVMDIGNLSDGYHTYNELYHHRAILSAALFNKYREQCWKSKKHHDGSMYENMFIVGINTPTGPATYHYDIYPYWELFDVTEVDYAPEWDGHSPADAIARIQSLISAK